MVSNKCEKCLELLARSHNVLISGPAGTGKSRLLAEIALAFEAGFGVKSKNSDPVHDDSAIVPIPFNEKYRNHFVPAQNKFNRKVFRTVFHQNSKYRDFVSGIAPSVNKEFNACDFSIIRGTLYRASEYVKSNDAAALLVIDEINRGPAVQVFGGSIVAIETDKRLAPDGAKRSETQYFEILDPESGLLVEYALPHDLYIVAAMNQADASVEPLDVAFLRRWEPLRLEPDENALRSFYGLSENDGASLPDSPANVNDIMEASVRAWSAINKKIMLGRGAEFQIGHGVLMSNFDVQNVDINMSLRLLCIGWSKIRAHVEEVFFGDTRGVAAAFNILDGSRPNPFKLIEETFAGDLRYMISGPINFDESNIYLALRAFSEV